jgi:hypothetical protein
MTRVRDGLIGLLTLILGASGVACNSNKTEQSCDFDSNCRTGELCIDHFCEGDVSCDYDSDCLPQELCVDDFCVQDGSCEVDSDCGRDQYCLDDFCYNTIMESHSGVNIFEGRTNADGSIRFLTELSSYGQRIKVNVEQNQNRAARARVTLFDNGENQIFWVVPPDFKTSGYLSELKVMSNNGNPLNKSGENYEIPFFLTPKILNVREPTERETEAIVNMFEDTKQTTSNEGYWEYYGCVLPWEAEVRQEAATTIINYAVERSGPIKFSMTVIDSIYSFRDEIANFAAQFGFIELTEQCAGYQEYMSKSGNNRATGRLVYHECMKVLGEETPNDGIDNDCDGLVDENDNVCEDQCNLNDHGCSGDHAAWICQRQSDRCLDIAIRQCDSDETCEDTYGYCKTDDPTCQDECRDGERVCAGDDWKQCGEHDTDSCNDWSSINHCGTDETCEDGYCVCEDECDADLGLCRFNPDGTIFTYTCVEQSDRCLDKIIEQCPSDETCFEGVCVDCLEDNDCDSGEECINYNCREDNTCTNECNLNSTRCDSGDAQECVRGNDGCTDWRVSDYCNNNETCQDGRCIEDEPEGVWVDNSTGIMWESPSSSVERSWYEARTYCQNLTLGSHTNWELPSIGELRTLVNGCATTETGGSCPTTDSCQSCWDDSCVEGCNENQGPDNGCYWEFGLEGPCDIYWSSTLPANPVWVNFTNGKISTGMTNYTLNVRCKKE